MRVPSAAPRLGVVLAAVSVGGAAGSVARYGVSLVLPHDAAMGVPWSTFAVNALGCLAIGVLMVLIEGRHPLLRPLLGVGFLGGFTTFSTYAVDAVVLAGRGAVGPAAAYVFGTLGAAVAGVSAGVWAARRVVGRSEADPHEADPHEADPREPDPREADPHDADPHDADPHDADPHDADPHDADPHEPDPHGADPREAGPHEAGPHEAGRRGAGRP